MSKVTVSLSWASGISSKDEEHKLVCTSRGAWGVLNHSRTEVRRLLMLKELGAEICPCITHYRDLVNTVRTSAENKGLINNQGHRTCYRGARFPNVNRLYRRWVKAHRAQMDKMGGLLSMPHSNVWAGSKFQLQVAEELCRRGHDVVKRLAGRSFEVSLGFILPRIEISFALMQRSSKSETYVVQCFVKKPETLLIAREQWFTLAPLNKGKSHPGYSSAVGAANFVEKAAFLGVLIEKGLPIGPGFTSEQTPTPGTYEPFTPNEGGTEKAAERSS